MRTLAIGDIHGSLTALRALLDLVAPTAEDRLVFLGDYVNRGPDSKGVLDLLLSLHAQGRAVCVRGNHDEMFISAIDDTGLRRPFLRFGGEATLHSYGISAYAPDFTGIDSGHVAFLRDGLVEGYETETHLFTHGNIDPDKSLAEQEPDALRWTRLGCPVAHVSGKTLVVGHTLQDTGLPLDFGTVVCIDTGAYKADGLLTCMDVSRRYYFQANNRGETRQGTLEELTRLVLELE